MGLHGGGETIEDVREIKGGDLLREVVAFDEMPAAWATGGTPRRMNERFGIEGMETVNSGRRNAYFGDEENLGRDPLRGTETESP
jgi:hypothetical protein